MSKRICTAVSAVAVSSFAASAAPFFPTTLSENTTGAPDSTYTGAPDDNHVGLGGQIITYDLQERLAIVDDDLTTPEFNLYEVDYGIVEFGSVEISVSFDGISFFNVDANVVTFEHIPGDETHSTPSFRQSYDLSATGLDFVRYIRLDGDGTGSAGGNSGFDPDAIGIHNAIVPAPSALACCALAGLTATRRRRR